MILGVPDGLPRCEPADVEVEVLIAFVAGVEVEHRGPQPQRRQQPGLEVVELGPTGGRAGHVQAPRLDGVDVHGPHDALRIGVGAGRQVERLVFGSVDGAKTSGARWPYLGLRWSPHGIDCSRTPAHAASTHQRSVRKRWLRWAPLSIVRNHPSVDPVIDERTAQCGDDLVPFIVGGRMGVDDRCGMELTIRESHVSVAGSTLVNMAFATEHPVLAHSEYRPVDDVVRAGGRFEVVSEYEPAGDQPAAIDELERRIMAGEQDVVLLGATGTGKSATTAWLIERLQRPTLVMAPNKTLAAQLANELREMLPHNAVEYFVSYYDYYQPEAYIAQTDTYIEKDSSINDDVERLRHSATSSLLSRRDVVVVASVSCIYGLGTPQSYLDRSVELKVGDEVPRDALLRLLVDVQYTRNDMAFTRGSFRVRGDTVEIIPSYEELAVRIEFFGDEIEALYYLHPLTGDVVRKVDSLRIFPATHYVAGPERMAHAISTIEQELEERLAELEGQGKLLEAQRLRMRTNYDVEMMRQVGFCSGIENYSRHIDGRGPAGSAPATLLDYFPEDFLMVIDESHVTVPQIGGMYEGDMSRKRNLVDFGFRLPSAVDNRPLTWEEFADRIGQTVYLSATPGPYELSQAGGEFVEQVIRPTGPGRPAGRRQADQGPDRRPDRRDPHARRARRARAGHHADQEDGRGPHRLPARDGHPGALPALRGRHAAPGRAAAAAAARRVRRPGRHQPAARGSRPARGVAGGDPRRRQGRVPAVAAQPDPDHRPRGAQRVRRGAHVRRQDHRLDDSRPSTRPSAAARSRSPTTRSTASTRSRCARRSPTSSTRCTARPTTPSRGGRRVGAQRVAGPARAGRAGPCGQRRGRRGPRHVQHAPCRAGRPDQGADRADDGRRARPAVRAGGTASATRSPT